MEHQIRRRQILEEMDQIECMGKGRLSEEYREKHKDGDGVRLGPYYNTNAGKTDAMRAEGGLRRKWCGFAKRSMDTTGSKILQASLSR